MRTRLSPVIAALALSAAAQAAITINVSNGPPIEMVQGRGGIQATISATGGTAPQGGSVCYTWTVTGFNVPGVQAFPSPCTQIVLSGTPTTPGNYNFSVGVTDGQGGSASRSLSVTVHPPLAIVTQALPDVLSGVPRADADVQVWPGNGDSFLRMVHGFRGRYAAYWTPIRAASGTSYLLISAAAGRLTGLVSFPAEIAGDPAATTSLHRAKVPVKVTVGGVEVRDILFAGLAPGLTGVYQLNGIFPAGVPTGPAVPIIVTAAGQSSPPVTAAIR